ncbi:MAG: dihydropteroate synthase [Elusimicrobia bacterium]|nr:dihydropteroate synthase [Elusimicrobiota bacterium]
MKKAADVPSIDSLPSAAGHPRSLPKIMGVLNVTPDSFFDGGRYTGESAWARFEEMVREGADLIDIGGESSRPGSGRVGQDEELRRVSGLLRRFHERRSTLPAGLAVSIDTMKAAVASLAVDSGAGVINDISALRHEPDGMLDALHRRPGVNIVLMHMRGDPATMQADPRYDDVVGEVEAFFEERLRFVQDNGVSLDRVILDPGIGFGKTLDHNLRLLRHLSEMKRRLGRPVLIGASRKSFIGLILNGAGPQDRLEGSLAAALWCADHNVDYLRVHDVCATRRALGVWAAMAG